MESVCVTQFETEYSGILTLSWLVVTVSILAAIIVFVKAAYYQHA